ncbi:MAG: UvrD-helicase domain-containing protein [Tenacibaculum sp.]
MCKLSSFKVYNASAGSGKTFTLVKEYLKILLKSENIFLFQNILAVTFTNKAAGEMKERVLNNLQAFAQGSDNQLLDIILKETSINKQTIRERSKKITEAILQNYSSFSITTIDSFTHKLIKSFAFDLGLNLNFEVEMDTVSLLNKAVELLVSKIGIVEDLTRVLIEFSLSKADDDKSWDITRELNDIAQIILNENDAFHFKDLASKTIDDFTQLKNKILLNKANLIEQLKSTGNQALKIIDNEGLKPENFIRASFPKFLKDVSKYNNSFDFIKKSKAIDKAIEKHSFYTKTAKSEVVNLIEKILPQLLNIYCHSKEIYSDLILHNLVLKSIVPIAVLNSITNQLDALKKQKNIQLNAEFNQLIANTIKNQPSPFIYERIGQRFRHYFIDEMQDTSVLQWNNLIPLINNALAQENGSLLLVGDAKQAIYRWRGGKAEQFIELGSSSKNPFQIAKTNKTLNINFRSHSQIVNFNNEFFQHVANFLQNKNYQKLFIEGNQQLENNKKGGYVSISFLEKYQDKQDNKLKYAKEVLQTLKQVQKQFSLSEVCVIVRKKDDGITIANYLSENAIPVISSETLLLKNNAKVHFIINLLQVIQQYANKDNLFELLYFLHQHLNIKQSKHTFISKHLALSKRSLLKALAKYEINFSLTRYNNLGLYQKIAYITNSFHLLDSFDIYVQFFLDIVLEQQRKGIEIQDFLDYWETKKDSLSATFTQGIEAVQIMTIHKSKGLEFPIVIFPCELNIYYQKNPKVWISHLPKSFKGFNKLLIPFQKNVQYIKPNGIQLYQQQREELELDNLNLLYVALTRAVEQLYIISDKKIAKNGENTDYYSGIFISYLKKLSLWNDDQTNYQFGTPNRKSKPLKKESKTIVEKTLIDKPRNKYPIHTFNSIWFYKQLNTKQREAIKYGNLIHQMLSEINTQKNISPTVKKFKSQNLISDKVALIAEKTLNKIITHPALKAYYNKNTTAYNEREMLTADQQIIIPDRLVIKNNQAFIIEYKTGKATKKHHQQMHNYAKVLKDMNFTVNKKLLVYIQEEILVEEL